MLTFFDELKNLYSYDGMQDMVLYNNKEILVVDFKKKKRAEEEGKGKPEGDGEKLRIMLGNICVKDPTN